MRRRDPVRGTRSCGTTLEFAAAGRAARVLRKQPRVCSPATRPPPAAPQPKETLMQWTLPAFEDLRFGFEITMYIASR